jgi:hypothetical protein
MASALAMSVSGTEGAAGTLEVTISLRNTTSATCTMNGFPGALLLGASGTALPTTVVRAGIYSFTNFPSALVTLAGGALAYFNLGYSDVTTGSETTCEMATQLEITPPNATTHGIVTASLAVCNRGTVTVSPVFSATSPETQTTAPHQP